LILREMIDAGLSREAARGRFFAVDRDGLLVQGMPGILEFQAPFAQSRNAISGWRLEHPDRIGLHDVVVNARPTVLIGVSGQAEIFAERTVRVMASAVARPVIFPLSNPVSRSEATPQDIEAWTGGRAVIGTGSPFPPIVRNGEPFTVDQPNNAYIFPGVGLGVIAVRAHRVTESMFQAAARALAHLSPARLNAAANLLPPVEDLRRVAVAIAQAVAQQARDARLCDQLDDETIAGRIAAKMWTPAYRPYRLKRADKSRR
jgi:malate dehydrogenase (oxaloacetate-decarboxylating)